MTTTKLISDKVMAEVRDLVTPGFQTVVTVKRRSVASHGSNIVANDYGDDEVSFSETSESVRELKGWLHSTPTPVAVEDAGQLITVNTYRLFLPVGSDILAGDEVVIGSEDYIVSDTTGESTWQALLTCSLRKRE